MAGVMGGVGGGGTAASVWGASGPGQAKQSLGGLKVGGIGAGGGGGGKTSAADEQAKMLEPTAPMEMEAERDPELDRIMKEMQKYRGELSKGKDVDAINAMQRQRDAMSGMAKEFNATAAAQGMGPGTGASALRMGSLYGGGMRDLSNLNAANTAQARQMQLQALQGQAGVAGQAAQVTQGQQNFLLDQWRAQREAALQAAQLSMQREDNARRDMLSLLGSAGDFFSG